MGHQGAEETVTLDVATPGDVDRLYLQVHRPAYRDASVNPGRGPKASVRLNGGPWIGLVNANVDVFEHEAAYGGLVSGYHTIRMTIPVSTLGGVQAGANALSFRFHGTDGFTVGYRVVDLNFLRADGSRALSADAFANDDPTDWSPPRPDAQDVEAGEALWQTAEIVDHPGGPAINATCGSCHAHDGRDLWYYAYSNESIVGRSEFHGLSREEGEQIASYIRSLQDKDETYAYDPPGRPWNPPFQPGPGLDAEPAHAWAAGAGLEWVLEDDADSIPHAFGPTIEEADVASDATLNMREIPLAIQYPDWNAWLPEVHPLDLTGEAFEASDPYTSYARAREDLSTRTLADLADGFFQGRLDYIVDRHSVEVAKFMIVGASAAGRPHYDRDEVGYEQFNRGFRHWAAVKLWELHREFDLEDEGHRVYGEYAEPRTWLGGSRALFDLASHISGRGPFEGQAPHFHSYVTSVWYQSQITVNQGNRVQSGPQGPTDWNYHLPFTRGVHLEGNPDGLGPSHFVRGLLSFAKMIQSTDMPEEDRDGRVNVQPFNMAISQVHPARMLAEGVYSMDAGSTLSFGEKAALYDAVLGALMGRYEKIPIEAWERNLDTDGDGAHCDEDDFGWEWAGPNYSDRADNQRACSDSWDEVSPTWSGTLAQSKYTAAWYWLVPKLRELGASEANLSRLINYGEAMWPLGAWDNLRREPGPDEPGPVEVHLARGWNALALPLAAGSAPLDSLFTNVINEVVIKDVEGNIYAPRYGLRDLSSWDVTQAYNVFVESETTLAIDGHLADAPDVAIPLQAGWNLLPFYGPSSRTIEEALGPILDDVEYLSSNDGGEYTPGEDDTVGMLHPGQGYLVRLARDAILMPPTD